MGALLLVPFFLIRFGLMALLDREALGRAAHFPPFRGGEQWAYWVYQLSTAALVLGLCPLRLRYSRLFLPGAAVYILGLGLLTWATVDFCAPAENGLRQRGSYRVSRNPMYVAYFVFFAGCVLLAESWALAAVLVCFQASAHWIILAEERWCAERFGEAYRQYRKRVRRYI
ncbi:isoprenylcysteine carboxylmethyltransferase family protein [Oscillospiraceae bacterium 38-13]